jgi:DNA-binding response OmpR family regulator
MKKILVVEDEIELLKVIESQLKDKNFEVVTATDGVEGLDAALRERPDLILLDIVMPKMDGMAMLAKLRRDSWGKNAKVILLTNLGDTEKVAEAIKLGTYDYLVKADWNINDVVKLVNDRLAENK